MLNLFAYTGAFSVYAAAGGVRRITSVDLSSTYLDWARHNVDINGLPLEQHAFVRPDTVDFVMGYCRQREYDLLIVDPPTFSNSKRTEGDWEFQRHHGQLLSSIFQIMKPGGIIYFSTNFRRFKLDEQVLSKSRFREISDHTVPEDFANKRTHRCWRMKVGYK